jgi:hypothetical protein
VDPDPERALAACLDETTRRLAQDRHVPGQPVAVRALEVAETVGRRLDLLAVVHHQREVVRELIRVREGGEQVEEHRVAGLHVHGSAAVQNPLRALPLDPAGHVVRDRDRVEMPGQHDPARQTARRPGQDPVAVPDHLDPSGGRAGEPGDGGDQCRVHRAGDPILVPGRAGDVDQRTGEFDRVGGQIEGIGQVGGDGHGVHHRCPRPVRVGGGD